MKMKAYQPAVWFPTVRAGSGTDVFTEMLADGLQRRGIQAEITWLPHRAEYAPWTVSIPKPPPWANVVHINSWLHPRFVPERLPIIVTVHHSVHDPSFATYKQLAQQMYHRFWILQIEAHNVQRASIVTAVSRYVGTQVQKLFDCPNVVFIRNGIDVESTFTAGPPREPHHPFRLVYVGNWVKRKGVDLLAPILERLGPHFELLYTGDRSQKHKAYRLPPNCRCLGRQNRSLLAQTYRDADALLFPSRSEGLPLTVIEAMACGLPVIAFDIPPVAEIVHHGITGFLCPVNQIDAIVTSIKTLAHNKDHWKYMRFAARNYAEQHFSLDAQLESYITVYYTAISQRLTRQKV